jgi:hypothetical protein
MAKQGTPNKSYIHLLMLKCECYVTEVLAPRLRGTSPSQPSAQAAAPSPAGSDDEVPIPRISNRTALVSCYGDAEVRAASYSLQIY